MRRRLEREDGFTLVELTIVLLVLGILMTIAVPSYLSFKDRANKTAAKADVAQTMRAVVAYGADNFPNGANDPNADPTDSGYTGITLPLLATKYDASISTVAGAPFVINPAGFTALLHRLLPDGCHRPLDRRAARPRQRHLRRHPVHARYLHRQLTPGSRGDAVNLTDQPADPHPRARRAARSARPRREHVRAGRRQLEDRARLPQRPARPTHAREDARDTARPVVEAARQPTRHATKPAATPSPRRSRTPPTRHAREEGGEARRASAATRSMRSCRSRSSGSSRTTRSSSSASTTPARTSTRSRSPRRTPGRSKPAQASCS